MSRINKTLIYILILIGIYPEDSNAQVTGTSRLYEMIVDFGGLLRLAVPIIFGLGMVYFFWNTANFILKDAGNEKTRRDGINKMIWGVVIIFVFVSIWGILGFLSDITGIGLLPSTSFPVTPSPGTVIPNTP